LTLGTDIQGGDKTGHKVEWFRSMVEVKGELTPNFSLFQQIMKEINDEANFAICKV
jgi:hypothetical protein